MKKLIAMIVVFGILAAGTGCGANEPLSQIQENPADPSEVTGILRDESSASADSRFAHMVLTKEEMLEDYDAIWEAFEENSPFMNLIERRHGPNHYSTAVAKHRQRIVDMQATGDDAMLEFIMIVFDSLYEACGVDRHAGVQNSTRFFLLQTAYRQAVGDMPELEPFLEVLNDSEISAFYEYYEYLMERMLQEMSASVESEPEWQGEESGPQDEALALQILEEGKIAYIRADSFDTERMERDLPLIRAFLEQARDYEHLIIDIRENGGGNSTYWTDAFVRPNIAEPHVVPFVRLMRDGDVAVRQFGSNYEGSSLLVEDVINNPAYTALRIEDMDQFSYAVSYPDITEPESDEKLFQGKIWVLVGPQVYSASESFAVFCKATGFATLVGKITGGGNTGGPVLFELPNSHMVVNFDVEYALNPDGSCSQEIGTLPDIESEDALQTVLDVILEESKRQ